MWNIYILPNWLLIYGCLYIYGKVFCELVHFIRPLSPHPQPHTPPLCVHLYLKRCRRNLSFLNGQKAKYFLFHFFVEGSRVMKHCKKSFEEKPWKWLTKNTFRKVNFLILTKVLTTFSNFFYLDLRSFISDLQAYSKICELDFELKAEDWGEK